VFIQHFSRLQLPTSTISSIADHGGNGPRCRATYACHTLTATPATKYEAKTVNEVRVLTTERVEKADQAIAPKQCTLSNICFLRDFR
jgi:hypothetical protein